jgi:hypothetical protein
MHWIGVDGAHNWPGDRARKRLHLFRQCWIGTNGNAQPVAKRVFTTNCACQEAEAAGSPLTSHTSCTPK